MRSRALAGILLALALTTVACNVRETSAEKHEAAQSAADVAMADLRGNAQPQPQASALEEDTGPVNPKATPTDNFIMLGQSVPSGPISAPRPSTPIVEPTVAASPATPGHPSPAASAKPDDDDAFPAPVGMSREQMALIDAEARSARVTEFAMGDARDEATHAITHQTTDLSTSAQAIYLAATLSGLKPSSTITGTLTAVDVALDATNHISFYEMASKELKAPSEETAAEFAFSPPTRGWPEGTYAVTMSVNGLKMQSVTFQMKKAQP